MSQFLRKLNESAVSEKNAEFDLHGWQIPAAAAAMPILAAAGMGAVGGAVSPRGSGFLPGAARGAGVGIGAELGAIGGNYAGDALDAAGHQNLGMAARILSPIIAGYAGYRAAKKLTKTREEELREAMLKWYGSERNYGAEPSGPPQTADTGFKLAAAKIPIHLLMLERMMSRGR
jgi:hypothetical protein